MRRRLFLVFLPSLYTSAGSANEAAWNCEQGKDGKGWVCVGEAKPAEKASEAPAPARTEAVKEAQPSAIPEPIQNVQQPVAPEPAQATRPVTPEPVKDAEPVLAKPDEDVKPAEAESVENEQPVIHEQDKRQVIVKRPVITDANEPVPVEIKEAKNKTATVAEKQQQPGWSCAPGEENQNWSCKLVGTDPKGQAQVVAADEHQFRLLDPAFDSEQERVFNTLQTQLKYDPWTNCSIDTPVSPQFVPEKHLRETSPLEVRSDYSELFDTEISSYWGNVQIHRADQHILSDVANYDTVSETLDLQGDVYYSEDELALHSDTAMLNLATDQGRLRDTMFISPAAPIRGRAKVAYRDSKELSRYKDVAYTSCQPGNQDWVVHASELKMSDATGKGSAKDAWLEFKGVPVFYSPYLSFPIDDRRISGFLAPSFGNTQDAGFNISVPYYWNIAPNYDATLRPRYLTKRGVLLAGDFRYLTHMTKGKASLEFMPDDSLRDQSRYFARLLNDARFTKHISSHMDLNYVSDKDYFNELGNAVSLTNLSYLYSQADIKYINEGVSFINRVDNYQNIDKAISPLNRPYRRLPQSILNLNRSFDFMPLDTGMNAEFVYFQHEKLVNGQRFNVKPSVSFPMETSGAFLKPKLSFQYTQYELSEQQPINIGQPDSISRALPIASVDSGLFFERDFDFDGSAYTHTIEPRLFYLYIPKKNQDNIPLFDTSLYDFNFSSLFRENRFSGNDRVQDANQVTAAVTSRLIDPETGKQRLRFDLGEIFYFRDREVGLCGGNYYSPLCRVNRPIETGNFSNLVSELNVQFTDHLSVDSGLQWSPDVNDIVRGDVTLHYINQPDEIINLGYRYRKNTVVTFPDRRNDIIQSDISFHWPVYNNWYAVGRWQYSLLNNATRESFIGFEKENCCWRFRLIGRRWVNSAIVNAFGDSAISDLELSRLDAEGESQTGVFFQVELKGLTGVGEKLDEFFQQNIYGYRKPQK
ncbi:LPS assembly protein LptD [Methylobacter sp. YRD-M1]|uniref:LPS assembly protein LptD n=1 Tax=Methylobacter sp. YRD-M1 TaxID=2911520 RepID=UPI00227C740B|nr:LPS assembly protein LptD [Methylobacter sp. YRD-M1]WAK03994.1 LPS assembly protein LptD [Methylobacter sp. YRD-M1]